MHRLGLASGVLIVVADMAGVGVLTTTGFMVRQLTPGQILLAWLVGGGLALCGAVSYGALARVIARSGGEYRYLSDLLHPAVGYIAGWTSFLVGFSAPVALAAYTAGAFTQTIFPATDPKLAGALFIIATALAQAFSSRTSILSQNVLAVLKAVLLVGFAVLGLVKGSNTLPVWAHTADVQTHATISAFMISLVYIAFSYSGWNAAVYAAEEFEKPERDVPRSMVIGTLLILGLYLVVNFVFVTNLQPERMMQWTQGDTERVTLAHLIVEDWLSHTGANVMSVVIVLLLASSISAMTLTGPRVYSAMAHDGFLPKIFAAKPNTPPRWALAAQAAIALLMMMSQTFGALLTNVGVILTASAALTAAAVFRVKAPWPARICAGVYLSSSLGILFFTLSNSRSVALYAAVAVVILLGLWRFSSRPSKSAA